MMAITYNKLSDEEIYVRVGVDKACGFRKDDVVVLPVASQICEVADR